MNADDAAEDGGTIQVRLANTSHAGDLEITARPCEGKGRRIEGEGISDRERKRKRKGGACMKKRPGKKMKVACAQVPSAWRDLIEDDTTLAIFFNTFFAMVGTHPP